MTIRIRAELSDGQVLVGPIMGNGGMLGSGALYCGIDAAERQALRALGLNRLRVSTGKPLSIFEPSPGHVMIYPDYSPASDGKGVPILLRGTKFEISMIGCLGT